MVFLDDAADDTVLDIAFVVVADERLSCSFGPGLLGELIDLSV